MAPEYFSPSQPSTTLSSSTSSNTATSSTSRRTLSTSTDSTASTIEEAVTPPALQAKDAYEPVFEGINPSTSVDGLAETPLKGSPLPRPAPPASSSASSTAKPTLILADRGDNAAKLLPLDEDGSTYVLQVSIGGRKLLVNPERPHEISFHDVNGSVVTRSLVRSPSSGSLSERLDKPPPPVDDQQRAEAARSGDVTPMLSRHAIRT